MEEHTTSLPKEDDASSSESPQANPPDSIVTSAEKPSSPQESIKSDTENKEEKEHIEALDGKDEKDKDEGSSQKALLAKRMAATRLAIADFRTGVIPLSLVANPEALMGKGKGEKSNPTSRPTYMDIEDGEEKEQKTIPLALKQRSIYQPKSNYLKITPLPKAVGSVASDIPQSIEILAKLDPIFLVSDSRIPPDKLPVDPPIDPSRAHHDSESTHGAEYKTPIIMTDAVPTDAEKARIARGNAEAVFSGPYAVLPWTNGTSATRALLAPSRKSNEPILPSLIIPNHPLGNEWLFEARGDSEGPGSSIDVSILKGSQRPLDIGPKQQISCDSHHLPEPEFLPENMPAISAPYCIPLQLTVSPRLPIPKFGTYDISTYTHSNPALFDKENGSTSLECVVQLPHGKPPLPPKSTPALIKIDVQGGGFTWRPTLNSTLHTALHRPAADIKILRWGPRSPVKSIWLGSESLLLVKDPPKLPAKSKARYKKAESKPHVPLYSVRGFASRKAMT